MDQYRRSLTRWPGRAVPAVLYAAVVFVASVVNPPGGGVESLGPLGLVGLDKWVHAGGYAALAATVAYALGTTTARSLVVAVVLATGYGAGIEVVQSVLPFRSFDRLDMLANGFGASLAALVLWAVAPSRADPGGD